MKKNLALLLFFTAGAAMAASIIPNGDFTQGKYRWPADSVIENTSEGGLALKMVTTSKWRVISSQRVHVGAGLEYAFSTRLKFQDATQTHIKINWLRADTTLLSSSLPISGQDGTRDWHTVTGKYTAPADTILAEVVCLAGGAPGKPGTSWFTGISLEPMDAEAHNRRTGEYKSIVLNGGFADSSFDNQWNIPEEESAYDRNSYAPSDDGNRQSLRITTPFKWRSASSAPFKVAPGAEYDIAMWYRLDNANQTHMKIAWYDANKANCGTTFVIAGTDGTTPWKYFETRFAAPQRAAVGHLQLMAGGAPDNSGTSWFDEISIIPVDPLHHKTVTNAEIPLVVRTLPMNAMKPAGNAVQVTGMSNKSIVIPANATGQDLFGAELLARLLGKLYNSEIGIVSDRARIGGKIISIGNTMQAGLAGVKMHTELQGYVIAIRDGSIYLRGSRSGSIYAVLALLQEDLGCRFYTAEDPIVIPAVDNDTAAIVPRSFVPPFEMREPLNGEFASRDEFNAFNRVQAVSYFKNLPDNMGGGFANVNYFIHTYDSLVPARKYFLSHPEYFPLRDGKRFPSQQNEGQLCYTSEGVADVMTRELEEAISRNPASRIYSISQNDNNWVDCQCPECQKVCQLDGIPGAALLLANRVADRLAKTIPDIRITTLAYVETQQVPKHIKPSPNTVIFYAPIRERAGALGSLPWQDVPKINEELQAWHKVAKRIYVWDYVNYVNMMPYFDLIDMNIEFWLQNGVTGVFLEDREFHLNSLAWLKNWIFMQKLWNPTWKLDDLIEEFIIGHYNEAAPEMLEYVAFQRNRWKSFYADHQPGQNMTFSPQEMEKLEVLLEKAYAKTPTRSIAMEICCLHKMNLKLCTPRNVDRYERHLKQTLELLEKHNILLVTVHDGHAKTIADWKEQLQDVRNGADYPTYSDNSLILKKPGVPIHHNSTVTEPGSYIQTVAKQVKDTDWGIQWSIDKLLAGADNQSTYVARIRVKPHLTQKHNPDADAFGVYLWRSGFSVSASQGRYMKFGDLKNNEWQYIYLYRVYFYSPSVAGYFYNTVGKISDDEYFLYDLIEFIPMDDFEDKDFAASLPQITM